MIQHGTAQLAETLRTMIRTPLRPFGLYIGVRSLSLSIEPWDGGEGVGGVGRGRYICRGIIELYIWDLEAGRTSVGGVDV